jgi:TetR/AcrR family transcriptional repressor of nem operon
MARPREFDEATVLDAAITCFWERGYRATSVRDLAAEMRISGPSLYNAFGDKRSLFRKALERYMQTSAGARITDLESSLPPKLAVRAFLADVVRHSIDDRGRRGCFLVNSALEIAPHDPEIGKEIADRLAEVEAFYRRAIAAAQADGSAPLERSPKDLARVLLGVTLGIRVLARSRPERSLLEGMARPALALLDWPRKSRKGKRRD